MDPISKRLLDDEEEKKRLFGSFSPTPPPPITAPDPDAASEARNAAKAEDKKARAMALMTLGGNEIGAAFGGVKTDDSAYKHIMGTANNEKNLLADIAESSRGKSAPRDSWTYKFTKGPGQEHATLKGYNSAGNEVRDTGDRSAYKQSLIQDHEGNPIQLDNQGNTSRVRLPGTLQAPTKEQEAAALRAPFAGESKANYTAYKDEELVRRKTTAKEEVKAGVEEAEATANLDKWRRYETTLLDLYDEAHKENLKVPFTTTDLPLLSGSGALTGRIKETMSSWGVSLGDASTNLIKKTRGIANAYIKEITGAQMSEPEAKRLGFEIPTISSDRATFKITLETMREKAATLVQQRKVLRQALGEGEFKRRMLLVDRDHTYDPYQGIDEATMSGITSQAARSTPDAPMDETKPNLTPADENEKNIARVLESYKDLTREKAIEALKAQKRWKE